MKAILMSLASVLLATTAMAMPSVGDYSKFNVVVSQGNQKMNAVVENSIVAFDQASGMYTIQQNVSYNGQSQASTEQRAVNEMLTDATATSIMAQCAAYGGALEKVTVPAGTFNTCKLPTDNNTGFMWIASGVAFGLVKVDQTENGQKTYGELAAFKNGK